MLDKRISGPHADWFRKSQLNKMEQASVIVEFLKALNVQREVKVSKRSVWCSALPMLVCSQNTSPCRQHSGALRSTVWGMLTVVLSMWARGQSQWSCLLF